MTTIAKPKGYGACPTFFFASCRTAAVGGTNSYANAGYTLAMHLSSLSPYDVEEQDWEKYVNELVELVSNEDDVAVLAWLKRWVAVVSSWWQLNVSSHCCEGSTDTPTKRETISLKCDLAAELALPRTAEVSKDFRPFSASPFHSVLKHSSSTFANRIPARYILSFTTGIFLLW